MAKKNESVTLTSETLTESRDKETHRITIVFDKKDYNLLSIDAEHHHLPTVTHGRVIILNYLDTIRNKVE